MAEFVHLHNHSHYSLLDGAAHIEAIVQRVQELGQTAFALTDHGNMFGVVEFYTKARKAGIKPILGMEAYVAAGNIQDRQAKPQEGKGIYHLLLLVKNAQGYKNLIKLSTAGFLEGFYFKPRIDKELLRQHSEGLIAATACLNGEVTYFAARGDYDRAKRVALEYLEIFGEGNFYLEVQRHRQLSTGEDLPEEALARQVVRKISEDTGIPLLATNDTHYVHAEHYAAHDALLCIGHGKFIRDPQRMRYNTNDIYIKSSDEMAELFIDMPEAIENTLRVAEACNFELELGINHMPDFPIPVDSKAHNLDELLKQKAWEGLERRLSQPDQQYRERLQFELEVIQKMGFSGYFLITQDFISYAKRNGIPVGPGRGSAAGSLVAYALGITDLDPIKYNLLFERFLNPERKSMPDIDVDFCYDRRGEVIDYIRSKYGDDSVTQIITFNKMKARAVIRDVGRVLEIPLRETDRLAKMVPEEPGATLERALEQNPDLREAAEIDDLHRKLFEYSRVLEGINRNPGKHAAGVVIAPGKLTDYVPLYKSPKEKVITTQYDGKALEQVGLIKFDFLGLRTLTVIQETVDLVEKVRGLKLDMDQIPLDDQKVYRLFAEGKTTAIFQFESSGMREYLKKLQPTCLEDLIAMNALYRPGPMNNIDEFIQRKQGRKSIQYLHPVMKDILAETYGIIVYQEQVMQLCNVIAGFSLAKADLVRRAMGKKIPTLMAQMKEEFLAGAEENHIERETANEIWDLIAQFALYGFNKSHSAAYALLAYRTAYLKCYYPAEFMAANLSSEHDNTDKVQFFLSECKDLGLEVVAPDVNRCGARFMPEDEKTILYGLNAIKKVGTKAAENIVAAREKGGPFKSIFDFCARVDTHLINKGVLESLVASGAMDSLPGTRAQKYAAIEEALQYGQRMAAIQNTLQADLFGGIESTTIKEPILPEVAPWPQLEELNLEREALGFYLSGHPLDNYREELKALSTLNLRELDKAQDDRQVRLGGIVSKLKIHYDRNSNQMAFFTITTLEGSLEALIFADPYSRAKKLLQNDAMVFLEGRISRRDENDIKLIVERVAPIQEFRLQYTKEIHVALDPAAFPAQKVEQLKGLAVKYAGPCRLVFHLRRNNHTELLIAARNIHVSASTEFLAELREHFGRENVWFTG